MTDTVGLALTGTAQLLRHLIGLLPFAAYYLDIVSFEVAALFGFYIVIVEVLSGDD